MKKLSVLTVLVITLALSSCASISKTHQAAPIAYTEAIPDEIKVDFDFNLNEKKVGKANALYLGFFKINGSSKYSEVRGTDSKSILGKRISKVKSAAMYNALQGSNSDMIIAPQYDVETNDYLFGIVKSYKVTVKGYEATIKKVYQIKP